MQKASFAILCVVFLRAISVPFRSTPSAFPVCFVAALRTRLMKLDGTYSDAMSLTDRARCSLCQKDNETRRILSAYYSACPLCSTKPHKTAFSL